MEQQLCHLAHLIKKSLCVDSLDSIPHLHERHTAAGHKLDLETAKMQGTGDNKMTHVALEARCDA